MPLVDWALLAGVPATVHHHEVPWVGDDARMPVEPGTRVQI